jgi:lysophospholipase L1-like esterase
MTGFGIGSANPATPPPSLPLGDAVWSAGGWFDLVSVPEADGAPIVATIPSLAGARVLTPQSGPIVDDTAIGGRRGCSVIDTHVSGTEQLFRCDAFAPFFFSGLPWCVVCDFRQALPTPPTPIWAAKSSTPGVTDSVAVYSQAQIANFIYRSPSTGIVTIAGSLPLAYDYNRIIFDYDGTTLRSWINGVPDIVQLLATPVVNVDRFAWLGSQASVSFEGASGFGRRLAVTPSSIGASGAATVDAYLEAQDFTLAPGDPLVPTFICAGASIILGTTDATTQGGYRWAISQYIVDNRLSWRALGNNPQGFMPTRQTPALGGVDSTIIVTEVSSNVDSSTKLVVLDLGNYEINVGQTAVQVEAAIASALQNIRTAVYAVSPSCAIAVSTILPYFEAPLNAVCIDVNAALPAIWDASDAAFPAAAKLLRADLNTAIGGPAYDSANYLPANDHPNHTGYSLLYAPILAASNSDGDTLAGVLSALSPT